LVVTVEEHRETYSVLFLNDCSNDLNSCNGSVDHWRRNWCGSFQQLSPSAIYKTP